MDNIDELDVMFQHLNVTGLSSFMEFKKQHLPLMLVMIDNGHIEQDAKKRKENVKLLLLIIILALRRRVGIHG